VPDRRAPAAPAQAGKSLEPGNRVPALWRCWPFDNISSDSDASYFSDGLTEELIARLSVVSEIELVSRGRRCSSRTPRKDLKAIGRELGARYIVGGSVRKFQDSVRITVQLVDAGTNRQIWGDTYKGKAGRYF